MWTFCILDGPRSCTCCNSIFFVLCIKSKAICTSYICYAIYCCRCFYCRLFKLIPRIINICEHFYIWIICYRSLSLLWSWIINIRGIFLQRLLTRFSLCSRCWRNLGLSYNGNLASYFLINWVQWVYVQQRLFRKHKISNKRKYYLSISLV